MCLEALESSALTDGKHVDRRIAPSEAINKQSRFKMLAAYPPGPLKIPEGHFLDASSSVLTAVLAEEVDMAPRPRVVESKGMNPSDMSQVRRPGSLSR